MLGAAVGSFLNVCIYRLPRGLAVHRPARSFCPHCRAPIPWYHNIPLVSWLALRAKCARCGGPIALRYLAVELLTALLFLGVWLRVWHGGGWVLAVPYWILVSLLVAATFIDLEHYIIPDEISLGGVVAGVFCAVGLPMLHAAPTFWSGGLRALVGAAAGYGLLRAIVELGKLVFGKRKLAFHPAAEFALQPGESPALVVGGESLAWDELFARPTDVLELTCPEAEIDGDRRADVVLRFFHDRLEWEGGRRPLGELRAVRGRVTMATVPREAMGMGDVKLLAAIGAFLGWGPVLFTVVVASVFGSVLALTAVLLGHREWSARIPFGPYLAGGAVLWILAGPEIVGWYLRSLGPP